MSQDTWDQRWMSEVLNKASWSKDRSRKVGCVIVDQENGEVTNGWNGFPRRINDDVEERHQRPAKYLWTEHAERNALYNAARNGRATKGCKSYQALYPCSHCARGLIQSGIVEIITVEPEWNDPTYAEEWQVSREMLAEAGVVVRFVEGEALTQSDLKPAPPPPQMVVTGVHIPGIKPIAPDDEEFDFKNFDYGSLFYDRSTGRPSLWDKFIAFWKKK